MCVFPLQPISLRGLGLDPDRHRCLLGFPHSDSNFTGMADAYPFIAHESVLAELSTIFHHPSNEVSMVPTRNSKFASTANDTKTFSLTIEFSSDVLQQAPLLRRLGEAFTPANSGVAPDITMSIDTAGTAVTHRQEKTLTGDQIVVAYAIVTEFKRIADLDESALRMLRAEKGEKREQNTHDFCELVCEKLQAQHWMSDIARVRLEAAAIQVCAGDPTESMIRSVFILLKPSKP